MCVETHIGNYSKQMYNSLQVLELFKLTSHVLKYPILVKGKLNAKSRSATCETTSAT